MNKLINTLMAALVILSSFAFVSCGDDDDDITNTDNKPAGKVKVYATSISEAYLDLYDISLVIYSGGKPAQVTLKKSEGEKEEKKDVTNGVETPYSVFCFAYDKIDEQHVGIDSVKAMVAAKENVESLINGMDQNKSIVLEVGTSFVDAVYSATGKYPALNLNTTTSKSTLKPQDLLTERDNVKNYELRIKLLTRGLTIY